MRGILNLFRTIQTLVPPHVFAVLIVLVLVLAAPAWLRSVHVRQIRSHLRAASNARSVEEKQRAEETAWTIAAGNPRLLAALAEEADRRQLRAIRDRAVHAVEEAGATKLLPPLKPAVSPGPEIAHPVEAIVRIRELMRGGRRDRALKAVREARERFPGDAELAALEQELVAPPDDKGAAPG